MRRAGALGSAERSLRVHRAPSSSSTGTVCRVAARRVLAAALTLELDLQIDAASGTIRWFEVRAVASSPQREAHEPR